MAAISMALTACASESSGTTEDSTNAPTVETVNFTLNWFPLADHAPNYVALEKGWFEEDGLGVNIIEGSGSGTSIRRVDTGQADVGIADVGVIINAIRNGAKIRMVMVTIDRGTAAVYASTDSGISTVEDLKGSTIGAPAEDAGRLIFPALAEANGFSYDDVEWVDIQPSAQWQILARKQVDAILSATTQAPFAYKALGGEDKTVQLTYADNGVDLYSQAIFTSERMIEERPDVLKDFLDSVLRGWEFTFENPSESLDILKKYSPSIDLEDYAQNLELVLAHNATPRFEEMGIGYVDEEKMQNTLDVIQEYLEADTNVDDVESIYTNEFLTKHEIP